MHQIGIQIIVIIIYLAFQHTVQLARPGHHSIRVPQSHYLSPPLIPHSLMGAVTMSQSHQTHHHSFLKPCSVRSTPPCRPLHQPPPAISPASAGSPLRPPCLPSPAPPRFCRRPLAATSLPFRPPPPATPRGSLACLRRLPCASAGSPSQPPHASPLAPLHLHWLAPTAPFVARLSSRSPCSAAPHRGKLFEYILNF